VITDDPAAILDEVKPYLSEWNIRYSNIELASHSENIVFKVLAEDEKAYALRVHRPDYHSLAELNSEQIWTSALLESGLRVPRVYATRSGDYYVSAPCGGVQRQLGLIAWLEGQPLVDLIASASEFPLQMFREAGAICAKFHNQASNWRAPPGFTRHRLNIDGLLGEDPFWGRFWEVSSLTRMQRLTLTEQRGKITRLLESYGECSTNYSMIHADLNEDNLFVADDGLMAIDFDDAGFGWHQYDLAVVLHAHIDRPDFDAIRDALIAGYRTQRNLSDEDLSMLEPFILVRTLALIGWVGARPELGRDDYLQSLIDSACRTTVRL
jgi:Ser/Thr protein kinase RdoA (MazF antagonist)